MSLLTSVPVSYPSRIPPSRYSPFRYFLPYGISPSGMSLLKHFPLPVFPPPFRFPTVYPFQYFPAFGIPTRMKTGDETKSMRLAFVVHHTTARSKMSLHLSGVCQ